MIPEKEQYPFLMDIFKNTLLHSNIIISKKNKIFDFLKQIAIINQKDDYRLNESNSFTL
jgi:hypothetical protein